VSLQFNRGAANARKASMCGPCRNRRHIDCTQENAFRINSENRMFGEDDTPNRVDVPYCTCYSQTDLHV
jgi:hypothetical protein